jgi:hypothetical protein
MKRLNKVLCLAKGGLRRCGGAVLRMLLAAYLVLPPRANLHAQAPESILFQLPLERAGDSFRIQENDGAGGWISTPLTSDGIANTVDENPTADSYLRFTAPPPSNDYFIKDETNGNTSPPNLLGTASFNRTSFLSTPWYTQAGGTPAFFMSLPADRIDHVLSLVTSGAAYAISNGPPLAYETTDASGQPTLAYYGFFDGSAPTAPTGPFFVLDSTWNQQSGMHVATEHDLVSNETWTSFDGSVPTRLLTILLDDSEGPGTFALHTTAGSVTWLTPQWEWDGLTSRYAYRVSTTVGVNQQFWLVRQQDGASTAMEWLGVTDLEVDATTAFTPYLSPNVITFPVGENYWGHPIVFLLGDGSYVTAVPDWTSMVVTQLVDYLGTTYYTFSQVNYTASIDAYQSYTGPWDLWTGSTALMDGYNPPSPLSPQPETVIVAVGENHWAEDIHISQPVGPDVYASSYVDGGVETASDSLGNPYYYYYIRNYYFTIDANQSYTLVVASGTTNLLDGYNPPYNPNDPADFSSLTVQLPASRANDTLEVHTSYGDIWPLHPDLMQGFWTSDQSGQSWFASYYTFTATGQSRVGYDWWIYDVTQNDESSPNTYDLSGWSYATATADSDGDGLVDWYELLIGLNPSNADQDGDGLPDGWEIANGFNPRNGDMDGDGMLDGWEVAHGFNPFDPSDASGDADGDGLSNLEEYRHGTDPHDPDTDHDGMPDGYEVNYGLNPLDEADGAYDADGDGLSNSAENGSGTNPTSGDTDGDGLPDLWEMQHGFNPLDPNDGSADYDSDGLSNATEYALGTDMWNSDTDGDGYPDAWELNHGGNPVVYEAWITFQLSPGRIGHHFTLWQAEIGTEIFPELIYHQEYPQGCWAEVLVKTAPGGARLLDDTAGDDLEFMASNSGTMTEYWGSAPAWSSTAADGTFPEYYILPSALQQHVLLICSTPVNAALYGITTATRAVAAGKTSFSGNKPQPLTDGSFVPPAEICEVKGYSLAGSDNWLVDLTTNQKAPLNANNLLEASWEYNNIQLPVEAVTVTVSPEDGGRYFTVTSLGDYSQYVGASFATPQNPAVIHAYVVAGFPYVVTRSDDGASVGAAGTEVDLAGQFPPDPNPIILPPYFQEVTVRVGENHYNNSDFSHYGLLALYDDGTPPEHFDIQFHLVGSGHVDYWDRTGQILPYSYLDFVAYVDTRFPYHFEDSAGNRNLWDGLPWLPDNDGASLQVAMTSDRISHDLAIIDTTGQSIPLTVTYGGSWDQYTYTASLAVFSGLIDAGVHSISYSYAPGYVSTAYPQGAFTVIDYSTGDWVYFPPTSDRVMLDLSRWKSNMSIQLEISASRLGHQLEIHTLDGEVLPITPGQFHSPWAPGTPFKVASDAAAWTFPVQATVRSAQDWWIYDRTTGEMSDNYGQNPTLWVASGDSDGDGLPDWFERAVGLSFQNTDWDGDGLPDGWEVLHGTNPFIPDADADPDSDGLNNLEEMQHGTEPRKGDTDGDGLSDYVEVAYGLDPLNPLLDSDGDGLSDVEEIQLGTSPILADTDGDGIDDALELAYGSNPLVPESLPVILLPPARTSHAFTLIVTGHTPIVLTPQLVDEASGGYAVCVVTNPGDVPRDVHGIIYDATAGETCGFTDLSSPVLDAIARSSWGPLSDLIPKREYFLIPMAEAGGELLLVSEDMRTFPVTVTGFSGNILSSTRGVVKSQIAEASAILPSGAYHLQNVFTGHRSPRSDSISPNNETNLLGVEWTSEPGFPVGTVTADVPHDDGGRLFSVYAGGLVQSVTATVPADFYSPVTITFFSDGGSAHVIRMDDRVEAEASFVPFTSHMFFDLPEDENPPPLAPFVSMIFEAGSDFQRVQITNGEISYPAYPIGYGVYDGWSAQGLISFPYTTYIAYYDPNYSGFVPTDEHGETELMFQPWVPPFDGFVPVALSDSRVGHELYVTQGLLSWLILPLAGYEDTSYYYTGTFCFADTAEQRSRIFGYHIAATAGVDLAQDFDVYDATTGESLTKPGFRNSSVSPTQMIDLGRWTVSVAQPLQVDISATRWGHDLRVHTGDGKVFQLPPGIMQGFWEMGTDAASFFNYWYFHAAAQFIQGEDWWIYDATSHDNSPPNQNDLSTWAPASSTIDTDGDGLPDWFEALIGTRSTGDHPQDTDGDGLPDFWEVQHHLDPKVANPLDADFDHDGLTDYEEYDLGLNPALADTDGDGIDDKDEITMGLDPLHPFVRPPASELSLEINLVLE